MGQRPGPPGYAPPVPGPPFDPSQPPGGQPPALVETVTLANLPDARRLEYLAWIRARALTYYVRAGALLVEEWPLPPDRAAEVDAWIGGARTEAECFATDLGSLPRRPWWHAPIRRLARWLWSLTET
jgi:hypothetical protein